MLSLSETLLYLTVRLEGKTSANNYSVGTGFLFVHTDQLFLVTNKHVIKDVQQGHFFLHRANGADRTEPVSGSVHNVNFTHRDFVGHPNPKVDVAVVNLTGAVNQLNSQGHYVFWRNFSVDTIPSQADMDKFIGALEEVAFVGYPNGLWDSSNNFPIIRKGITATPYAVDFQGEPVFLIDASVFPGSSGSPVFIYYAGTYADKQGNAYVGNRLYFLGIVARTFRRLETGRIVPRAIPTRDDEIAEVAQMLDLGIVYRASTIVETIESGISDFTLEEPH